jgi:hypothetical protein
MGHTRTPAALCVVAAVAILATVSGCGGSVGPPAKAPPTAQSSQAVFPVTLTRVGGVAGFHDVMLVAGDGTVSLARNGRKPLRCRLVPSAAQRLAAAASQVQWSGITPARTKPSFPDDMVTTLQSPAGGPVSLKDAKATSGQAFLDLLNDLTSDPSTSRICKAV